MANFIKFKESSFRIGDTLSMTYKLKEGDKERKQIFKGILIKARGSSPETKMITVRKISRSGIGVEKIIPLASPFLLDLKLVKKGLNRKAKIYYVRELSDQQLTRKLYRKK